jgi:hypothetical protein
MLFRRAFLAIVILLSYRHARHLGLIDDILSRLTQKEKGNKKFRAPRGTVPRGVAPGLQIFTVGGMGLQGFQLADFLEMQQRTAYKR